MSDEQGIQIPANPSVGDESVTESAQVPEAEPAITLDHLVSIAIEQDASDIHFGADSRIALRVRGKFVFVENVDKLSKSDMTAMIKDLLPGEAEQKRLKMLREIDFSYIHSSGVSFRVNLYYSRGNLTASMRMISKHLPRMSQLGIPAVMKRFLSLRQGLILVAGTTGSGKSTSIQAMLEYVNDTHVAHIITIENPIEHVFKENKSIFSQRELGKDTLTFANAIRSATREDPNIVMVGDVNDRETMDALLNLVEMGHLAIAALPAKNALQTIEHVLTMYPYEERKVVQERFAENLAVILAQDLLERADQPGRAAVYEVLVGTKGVKNIIRRGSLSQLKTAMEAGPEEGMITMEAYAYQLAENGIISQSDYQQYVPENS